MPTEVLDPAAQHTDLTDFDGGNEAPPAEPQGPQDDALHDEPDDYAPAVYTLELSFQSSPALEDAHAVWRRANELMESAKAKGLELVAGGVYPAETQAPEPSREQMEAALVELARLEAQEAPN